MKNIFSLLCCTLFAAPLFAQNTPDWFPPGTKWQYDYESLSGPRLEVFEQVGLETFEGHFCAKLHYYGYRQGWPTLVRLFDAQGHELARCEIAEARTRWELPNLGVSKMLFLYLQTPDGRTAGRVLRVAWKDICYWSGCVLFAGSISISSVLFQLSDAKKRFNFFWPLTQVI